MDFLRRQFGAGPPDPEDIAQLAFEKLLRRKTFSDLSSVRAFLWSTAKNLSISSLRRNKARASYDSAVQRLYFARSGDEVSPARVVEAEQQLSIIAAALRHMPENRRQTFVLHRIEGLNKAEVARRLGISRTANAFGYVGDQDHRGFEIALSGDLSDRLRLITGAIALNATINNPNDASINGKRPAGVTEFQFSAYVDYEPSFIRGLALNLGIFHTGERLADNQNTFAIDAFTRIDLGGRYAFRLGDQALTARLNVRNVTDAAFVEGTAFGSFFFGSPRAAFVSIATEF